MRVWRAFVWHFLWCCATIAALMLSQAIYPWAWLWEIRNAPPHEERLITSEELCAPDNPDRSVFAKSALDECARWEKSKSRSGQ